MLKLCSSMLLVFQERISIPLKWLMCFFKKPSTVLNDKPFENTLGISFDSCGTVIFLINCHVMNAIEYQSFFFFWCFWASHSHQRWWSMMSAFQASGDNSMCIDVVPSVLHVSISCQEWLEGTHSRVKMAFLFLINSCFGWLICNYYC